MKSKLKLLAMLLFIFILLFKYGYAQKSTLDFRDDIISMLEQQAKNTFGTDYVVSNYVIMDSVIGKGPIDGEMEDILDPNNTLTGIIIFTTYTEDNSEEQYFCLFENNSIIWYYEDKIEYWWGGQIFTTNDFNNDGKVEIVTIWISSAEYIRGEDGEIITLDFMYIFNWDGVNGNLLNDPTFKSSSGMFEMIDIELDEVYEFRAYWEPIWGDYSTDFTPTELPWVTFGWNSSQYIYLQEIQIPGHQYLPTNGLEVDVFCKLSVTGDEFEYNYTISSSNQSKQRINAFYLKDALSVSNYQSPSHWKAQVSGSTNGISWYVFPTNKFFMIYPDNNRAGFGFNATGLPSISYYYILGYQPGPHLHGDYAPPFSIEEFRNNKLNNSVSGMTLVPKDPPDPFIPLNFLDTLLNYNQRSLELGWITNQATADKYDSLFNTAKTLLVGNHIPWVDSILHTVLEEVDEDSSGNITSEAYALLRYNTEYLLENLPEVTPPVLNSLSPEVAYVYPNADLSSPFTVTATGAFFTDSSVVYFNGNAKTTAFVSDSILTFQLNFLNDVPNNGNYPVWVRDNNTNSDTLNFSRVSSLSQSVAPLVECVHDNGDHTYTAYFSYNNNNSVSIYIPLGSKNYVQSILAPDRGQPRIFLTGQHTNVFSASFPGTGSLMWYLHQSGVTASRTSTPCP